MSILSRFADIMSANMNALLDKLEDPSKMIDQYMRACEKDLAKVKAETATVMAQEVQAQRVVDNCAKEMIELENAALEALKRGEEADAVKLIERKTVLSENKAVYEASLEAAKENSAKMVQLHDKLKGDYEVLKAKQSAIKSKAALVKTKSKMSNSNYSFEASGISKMDRLNDKLDLELDKANAMAALENGADSVEAIKEKYTGKLMSDEVASELERLKSMVNA